MPVILKIGPVLDGQSLFYKGSGLFIPIHLFFMLDC